MANFLITGSGVIDLRATDLSGFDGVTFGTSGNTTAQINTTLVNGANITGSGFADTLDIFVTAGGTITGQEFTFTNWSANDLVVFRDADPLNISSGNETIIGTSRRDLIHIAGGQDTVHGGAGNDLLSIYYVNDASSFVMANGNSTITDNINTSVSFTGMERFDVRLGSGNDVIVLGAGADTIFGGSGDDSLDTRTGTAVVNGGNGIDRWSADLSAFSGSFTIDLSLAGLMNIGNGCTLDSVEVMTITSGSGNDSLKSRASGDPDTASNDIINGFAGNDTVLVGGGQDMVTGGSGKDLLIIDFDGDSEAFFMANGNTTITDGLNTSVTFSGFERIEYFGSIGNDTIVLGGGDDTVSGNNGNDSLDTGAGAAIVSGGAGTDLWAADLSAFAGAFVYTAGLAGVQNIGNGCSVQAIETMNVIGGTGDDTFTTIAGGLPDAPLNDTINGFSGNDTITVSSGNDVAIGGSGSDLLIIDFSNDNEAFVMAAGNTVITDNVNTSVTFSGFERLDYRGGEQSDTIVLGAGNDIAKGNAGNDSLTGGGGNDVLDGGAGNDILVGGTGDDTYVVNVLGDTVTELAGQGSDTVQTGISYTLGANVERLTLTGFGTLNGTGNKLGNAIEGNAAANRLSGLDGNDTLTGGGGLDVFVLSQQASSADTITDFQSGVDSLEISAAQFGSGLVPGALPAVRFRANATGLADDANDRFIYNTTNGELIFDSNGSAAGGARVIATFTGTSTAPVASDFDIV